MDAITLVNLILCVIVAGPGLRGLWEGQRQVAPVHCHKPFGLFGLSHLLTLLGSQRHLRGFPNCD